MIRSIDPVLLETSNTIILYPEPRGLIERIAETALDFLKDCWSVVNSLITFKASRRASYTPLVQEDRLQRHQQQCLEIQKQFIENKTQRIILEQKQTTFLYRPRSESHSNYRLDLRALNQIISIDQENRIAHVQGLITFYDLLDKTLEKGLRPLVVPELRGITVGGGIAGLSVESGSWCAGLFHHTVIEMEVLTGSGEIVACSLEKNRDLFLGIPNSYGSLGYILSAKIKLAEAKPYVDVQYHHFTAIENFFAEIKKLCELHGEQDFIDGVIFSENHMVLVVGKSVDTPSYPPAPDYVKDAIYHHSMAVKTEESFTYKNYTWRWDTHSFWSTDKIPFLQNPLFTKTLGPLLLRTDRLSRLQRFVKKLPSFNQTQESKKEELIQDVGIPLSQCPEFYHWFKNEIAIHPIFICPVRKETLPTPLWQLPSHEVHCDFGFFSEKETVFEEGHYNRKVENRLAEIGGRKSLYSRTYYSEDQFKELYYGNGEYDRLKHTYDPDGRFPTLFEKCVKGH